MPYKVQEGLGSFDFEVDDVTRHGINMTDPHKLPELKKEYKSIVRIRNRSIRCAHEHDHETGSNHAVHTKVLELALG